MSSNIRPTQIPARLIKVNEAWARNSSNTVIFRRNSLITVKDTQFIAFYDGQGRVVVGKRKRGSDRWELRTTVYSGHVTDAHKSISLSADGDGYLHLAWDHHNNPLNYCRSVVPGSLEMGPKMNMTGLHEERLTYPEFYRLPGGDLIFLYRDGASGNGNLVIDRYDHKKRVWTQVQSDLIDGEGKRNAYWQACVDEKGTLHISWVWRESPDVASNHDICYARSTDGGVHWQKSSGESYRLPITAASAEYAWQVPKSHELINQTSMCTDAAGNPLIATYWRQEGDSVPQYQLVWLNAGQWHQQTISHRKSPFSLSGGGTKRIPVSRPLILARPKAKSTQVLVIFRDEERGSRVSVLQSTISNAASTSLPKAHPNESARQSQPAAFSPWRTLDLTTQSVSAWEPTCDPDSWRLHGELNLFVQSVEQGDGETLSDHPPTPVYVLEWKP